MKLLDDIKFEEVYDKKVQVELSVGEIFMLLTLSGNSNSNMIYNNVTDRYSNKHASFGKRIISEDLNDGLYNDLKSITENFLGEDGV